VRLLEDLWAGLLVQRLVDLLEGLLEVLLMVLLVWLVDLSEVLNRSVLRWDSLVVLRVEDHEQLHLEVLMGDL